MLTWPEIATKGAPSLSASGDTRNQVCCTGARKLTEFAEKLKLPVINTMMAKGAIPFDNPYSLWTVGIPMEDYQTKVLENASLVICIGYDIIEYAPNKWHLNNADIIHIDSLPADINKTYQPEVGSSRRDNRFPRSHYK